VPIIGRGDVSDVVFDAGAHVPHSPIRIDLPRLRGGANKYDLRMLALKAVSHDAFAAAQMNKPCSDFEFLNPLPHGYAVASVYFFALIESDKLIKLTR
jgi:hypothetical protein